MIRNSFYDYLIVGAWSADASRTQRLAAFLIVAIMINQKTRSWGQRSTALSCRWPELSKPDGNLARQMFKQSLRRSVASCG